MGRKAYLVKGRGTPTLYYTLRGRTQDITSMNATLRSKVWAKSVPGHAPSTAAKEPLEISLMRWPGGLITFWITTYDGGSWRVEGQYWFIGSSRGCIGVKGKVFGCIPPRIHTCAHLLLLLLPRAVTPQGAAYEYDSNV